MNPLHRLADVRHARVSVRTARDVHYRDCSNSPKLIIATLVGVALGTALCRAHEQDVMTSQPTAFAQADTDVASSESRLHSLHFDNEDVIWGTKCPQKYGWSSHLY